MTVRAIMAAALAAGLAATPLLAQQVNPQARADLVAPDGTSIGTATLAQGANGVVVISVQARGLPEGMHGFHIHQTGQCEPDFQAAGDHYNPDDKQHGYMNEAGFHAGDLPNIQFDAQNNARADMFTTQVSLAADAPNTVFDTDGSAFIIHENPDSYQAEAGAGGRLACGVIQPAS